MALVLFSQTESMKKSLFRPPSGAGNHWSDTQSVSLNPQCLKNLNLLNNGVPSTPFVFLKAGRLCVA